MSDLSVIFLLYNAEKTAARLVESILAQNHPEHSDQAKWLDFFFMDDGSRDATVEKLRAALAARGNPAHIKVVVNEKNLGLAGTLNKAFAMIRTPYGLTCHLDCFFGREDYVSEMLRLMKSTPRAAAITGQPAIEPGKPLPIAEKVNLVGNLMDIFPEKTTEALVPIGFAEGRCDIFRKEALEAAGYYDTSLRTSGEDQLLAARMRQKGYEIFQAPALPYYLSVSDEQNSLTKLLKHQQLFGQTQPYILFTNRKALAGISGKSAGENRKARMLLRGSQLLSVAAYLSSLVGLLSGLPLSIWALPLTTMLLLKIQIFHRHLGAVRMTFKEQLVFWSMQPLLDLFYTFGLTRGVLTYFWSRVSAS